MKTVPATCAKELGWCFVGGFAVVVSLEGVDATSGAVVDVSKLLCEDGHVFTQYSMDSRIGTRKIDWGGPFGFHFQTVSPPILPQLTTLHTPKPPTTLTPHQTPQKCLRMAYMKLQSSHLSHPSICECTERPFIHLPWRTDHERGAF